MLVSRPTSLAHPDHVSSSGNECGTAILLDFDGSRSAPPVLKVWLAGREMGTTVLWRREAEFLVGCIGNYRHLGQGSNLFSGPWLRRAFERPELLSELSGIFALFIVDEFKREALVASDRIGVQPVYKCEDAWGRVCLCTHLSWLLLATQHDGTINQDDFFAHMAFGYVPDQAGTIYSGVTKLAPGSCARVKRGKVDLCRYWAQPNPETPVGDRLEKLSCGLRRELEHYSETHNLLIGLTAGKDSLCLASHFSGRQLLSGTFGAPHSADRLQAARISGDKQWPAVTADLCPPAQIEQCATYVAFHSGGLATASYVDMAWFASNYVPKGHAYVMGEGGECVRDFFQNGESDAISRLARDYMTPKDYLASILSSDFADHLRDYPERLISSVQSFCGGETDDEFALRFYRTVRMPGNFSQRHAFLSTIRPKLSPFLSAEFIDTAFPLESACHRKSQLHRDLIAKADPDLLLYFDNPVKGERSVQDWHHRFSGETGEAIEALLRQTSSAVADIFDPDKLHELCCQNRNTPSRALFMLLRVLSFALSRTEMQLRRDEHVRSIEKTAIILGSAELKM